MRTNIVIDDTLMAEAMKVSALKTKKSRGRKRVTSFNPNQKTKAHKKLARQAKMG